MRSLAGMALALSLGAAASFHTRDAKASGVYIGVQAPAPLAAACIGPGPGYWRGYWAAPCAPYYAVAPYYVRPYWAYGPRYDWHEGRHWEHGYRGWAYHRR